MIAACVVGLAILSFLCGASASGAAAQDTAAPKLVVLVSIDQFPRSYIDRFRHLFVRGGFLRLLEGGADFSRCSHGHAATWTGPGHAVILTGADPYRSGIIGNQWFSRATGQVVGCVEDGRFPIVGAAPGGSLATTGVSPRFLRANAVGDTMRVDSDGRAVVLSIAGKDRAAVLMGGWRPNAAYWFDNESCGFVSSRYYVERLPDWASAFNFAQPCAAYLGRTWDRLRDDVDYASVAAADDLPYEMDVYGLGRVFPHPIEKWQSQDPGAAALGNEPYRSVGSSPFGNELVLSFAREAVRAEQMGADDTTDLLAVGLSSNDYIGHFYGPNSQEVVDVTLRTDEALRDFMRFLDREIGGGAWTMVVTSDHGIAPIPEYLAAKSLLPDPDASYRFRPNAARAEVEKRLREKYFRSVKAPPDFAGFITAWNTKTHPFVYLHEQAASAAGAKSNSALAASVAGVIESLPGVARVDTLAQREQLASRLDGLDQRVFRAWDRENGGDLQVTLSPHWVVSPYPVGTNHGSPYEYDTHVPLLLYGAGVHPGRYARAVSMVDIAPTLASIIGVPAPSASQGEALVEVLR